jgi:putative aldouronate transport system substrate-binding protein
LKRKRALAGICAAVLLISALGGCKSNPSSSSSNANVLMDNGRQIVGNMYVSELPVLKEKTTYKIAISVDSNSKNTMKDKAVTTAMENQTNIHIEWQEIPSSGWDEKVNIMLASNDLPDAFSGQIKNFMKNKDAFARIDTYIEKYAPNIKAMFKDQPALKASVTAPDGKIYCLPTNRSDASSIVGQGLWINKVWLDKLGLAMPTTTAEFENVLNAFKTKDPNGNGKADEIPLGAEQGTTAVYAGTTNLDAMLGSFGVVDTQDYVYVQNGKVIFPAQQQGYFDGLTWLHKLYSQGLLDQDVFTMTDAQYVAKGQSKDLLYGCVVHWIPDALDKRFVDYVAVPPLKGPDGKQLWTKSKEPVGNTAGFSITTKCKNPEILVRYYDNNISTLENEMLWFNGPQFAGNWEMVGTTNWQETTKYYPAGATPVQFKRTVAVGPSSVAYLWSKWDSLRIQEPRIQNRIAANQVYLKYAVQTVPMGLDDPTRESNRALLFVDIDNYMKKFKANSVVQGITQDQWKTHLSTLTQLKVSDYVKSWQEYIDFKK